MNPYLNSLGNHLASTSLLLGNDSHMAIIEQQQQARYAEYIVVGGSIVNPCLYKPTKIQKCLSLDFHKESAAYEMASPTPNG